MARVVTVLAEKRRGLKKIPYARAGACVKVQVIAGDRDDQYITGVLAEGMKVSFSGALLLCARVDETRFLTEEVLAARLFQNDFKDRLIGDRITDRLESVFDLVL